MRYIILQILVLLASLAVAHAHDDSTAGYHLIYIDMNQDNINDSYQSFADNNPVILSRDSTTFLQYKYPFGLGYGYGFCDRNGNGINDVLDSLPNIRIVNPTVAPTRIKGLEIIKRAQLRHSEVTSLVTADQLVAQHALHDGHCKSDSTFQVYRKKLGF
jgi:hypothetical protein